MSVHTHTPHVGRRRLGRRSYGSGGDLYGTVVFCRCTTPGWRDQVNHAPSSGGTAEAMHRWWEHVAADLAALAGHRWSDLSIRLRRQFYCEGYTAQGESCGAHATRRYGADGAPATVVLCTPHARLAGDQR